MEKTIFETQRQLELGEKLSNIQFEFKAQKSNFNAFGKYKFRSAEDILEALKPFNQKYKVYFTINESLINANPPIMQSIATIFDVESGQKIDAQAIVEIDKEQKGMAMPQRYGSASSYGKKYALGNLLLIDDTADADATNKHEKTTLVVKAELKVGTTEYSKALDYMQGGGDITLIEKKYTLTAEVKEALLNNK
jgi:hypothetical protein